MDNKKLVRGIRKLAGIVDEVIPDETLSEIINERLSYLEVLDLERDILFHGGPSFKDHFVEVYNELVRKAK